MHCHLRPPVPPVVLGFNRVRDRLHATGLHQPINFSKIAQSAAQLLIWLYKFSLPIFQGQIFQCFSLIAGDKATPHLERTEPSSALPMYVLYFRYVASFRNQSISNATGVKNRGNISDFSPLYKIRQGWAKYESKFFKFSLGLNLWYTLPGRRRAGSEIERLMAKSTAVKNRAA